MKIMCVGWLRKWQFYTKGINVSSAFKSLIIKIYWETCVVHDPDS